MALTAAMTLAAMVAIGRPLLFSSIDAEAAAARGVPARALALVFLVLLGLAVAISVQLIGTLLTFALIVTPLHLTANESNDCGTTQLKVKCTERRIRAYPTNQCSNQSKMQPIRTKAW